LPKPPLHVLLHRAQVVPLFPLVHPVTPFRVPK
jgi:hypothetical protein